MADEGISFRIDLDSADAQKALDQLQQAGNGLFETFKKMGEALDASGFDKLVEVTAAAAAGVVAFTGALFGSAEAAASNVVELSKLAGQIGATVEQMSGLQGALVAFGASGDTMLRSFDRLGNTIQTTSEKARGFSDVEDAITRLVGSVPTVVTRLGDVSGGLGDISRHAPVAHDVMLRLADMFHQTSDQAFKTAIATKLFGRTAAAEMVESLSVGSAALLAMEERARALGLVITEDDEKLSKRFLISFNELGHTIGIVATQLGLLFQPGFTALMDSLRTTLEQNRGTLIGWGEAIRDTVMPAIESLARALAGTAEAGKDDWAVRAITGVKAFGAAVSSVIGGLVIPLFRGLLQMAEGVAFGINQVFGTAFTGLEVLFAAMVARMALAFGAMLVGAGPVGLAIIGIGLALGLLITYWPQISAKASETWEAVLTGLKAVVTFIEQWVTTPVANAWQWIKDIWNGIVSWISDEIAQATQLVSDWVTTPVANAWQWIVDKWNAMLAALGFGGGFSSSSNSGGGGGGFAGGGLLGGSGSGTSDSNLAWVSRGEYITPAAAVAQPGVLAFLEALRRSGGNLRHVLDGMGRFALGGMVRGPLGIPAFAGGGMNHITINFPGLPEITGLRASSGVVDELRKAAAMAQVRSGGRKPSRYS